MTSQWSMNFCLFLTCWSALEGGVFKAFSEFIMKGLMRANPDAGIEAMQQINRVVLRTEFVASLFAIPMIAIGFAIAVHFSSHNSASLLIGIAALTHLCSVLLVTVFGNVPMNNHLDKLDHRSKEAALYWTVYGQAWTRLNHLRTLGSVLTASLYASAVTLFV